MTWSPGEKKIAMQFNGSGIIDIFDVATGMHLHAFDPMDGFLADVAWSPDGAAVACLTENAKIHVWLVNEGVEIEWRPKISFPEDNHAL